MLLPGDWVEVLPAAEILKTLDSEQALDGMTFMPEMLPYCGGRFRVAMRAERTCIYPPARPLRRLADCVVLDGLRCDGAAHGGCQLGCMMLWKEAWLRQVDGDTTSAPHSTEQLPVLRSMKHPGDEVYFCQGTELEAATEPGESSLRPGQYLRFVRVGTFTAPAVAGMFVTRPLLRRVTRTLDGPLGRRIQPGAGELPDPPLQAGEIVVVRSRQEIAATLDERGINKGLAFGGDMIRYCGQRVQVRARVETIMDEKTGKLRRVRDTVMLEGAICNRYLGCSREMPLLWREIWLRRVEPDGET